MPLSGMITAINAFLREKPWKLAPGGGALVFGVKEPDGQIGYAVVTGQQNGYALALCRGEQALAGYAALQEAKTKNENELEQIGLILDQDCMEIRCAGGMDQALERWLNVFGVESEPWPEEIPSVFSYRPGQLPLLPDVEEKAAFNQALLAAADYVKNPAARTACEEGKIPCAEPDSKGGFIWSAVNLSDNMNLQFPSPALDDELAARRLRRLPVSGAQLRASVRRLPMPMDEETNSVPTVMILIDDRMGVVAAPMIEDYEKDYGNFAAEYIGYVEEFGRPKQILTTDPRTFSLLSGLAAQMSTPIQRAGSMPEINDAIDDLMEFLKAKVSDQREAADEIMEFEPATDVPGRGGVLWDGFEGSMEEVGEHLLKSHNKADDYLEENLLLRLTYPQDPAFWLYAAVKTDASLRHIDNFIRNQWVECCGHASFFEANGVIYSCNTRILPGKSMNAKVIDVMKPGQPIDYEYDMGSPTDLQAEIVGTIRIEPRREKLMHLAQNYMPKYKCVRCGRRAELVARPDLGPIAENVICARCSREQTEIGAYLPLINSPRTGVCGYGLWYDDEDDDE